MNFLIWESMNSYSHHFSFNAQGTSVNYIRFLREIELELYLTLIEIGVVYCLTVGSGMGRGVENGYKYLNLVVVLVLFFVVRKGPPSR